MNQYLMLRRVRGPVILVTIGVMALLDQYNVLSFGRSWPLILIVLGVLMLVERILLSQMPPPPPGYYYPAGCGVPVAPVPGQPATEYGAQPQEERKL